MVRLRSATTQGHRPTAALLCDPNPNGEWTRLDYLLQDAFFMMDREVCTICNNPIWLCHSTDNRIEFAVKTRTCYAKAEIEAYEKTERGKSLGEGEYLIAKPIGLEDGNGGFEELPNRRDAYQKLPND